MSEIPSEVHVVVLTALDVEFDAVKAHLTDITTYRHPAKTIFEIGTIRGTSCHVALGITGAGNNSSGPLAERAISTFSPAALIFSGIAGALRDLPLGTVVVANKVYAYHGGLSEDTEFSTRPAAWHAPHGVEQLARHLGRNGSWRRRLPKDAEQPQIVHGAIAAGEVVLNSIDSTEATLIRRHYNDAAAIEMEGAGVAQAGHFNAVPTAVVRGISDLADGNKTTENDRLRQPVAAVNAAAFAVELAVQIAEESKENDMAGPNRRTETPSTVHNTTNNAGFAGVQGTNVSGVVVNIGSPTQDAVTDPAPALKELRRLMELQHQNGTIDRETLDDAAAELDDAENAYPDGTTGRKKAVRALKRLGGMAGDTLDVPAKIAAVIAALSALA